MFLVREERERVVRTFDVLHTRIQNEVLNVNHDLIILGMTRQRKPILERVVVNRRNIPARDFQLRSFVHERRHR